MLLLSTDTLRGYGLNRTFQFAKDAGFDGIDLQIDPKNYDTANASYIKALSEEAGLPVLVIGASPDANAEEVTKTVEMAKEVGAKVVVIQAPKILNFKYTSWLRKNIPKIRERERISICLENAPSTTFLGFIPEHAMNNISEMKKFKHACLDTSRVAEKHQDLLRVYNSLKKYLVHIHLSNVKKGKKYFRLDEGILPLESFLTKLRQDDYQGFFSIRVNPKFIKAGHDSKMTKFLKEFRKFFAKYYENVEVKKKGKEENPE